jgi:O-antigen ligase
MRDFPITGVGIGTFERVVRTFYPLFQNEPGLPPPHAHNLYLQMGVDFGIGGLAAFLALVVTAVGVGIRNIRRATDATLQTIAVGLLAGYVTYLAHSLLDAVALSTKLSVIVWLILALMMGLATERVKV